MRETFEHLVARLNANSYIPPHTPTAEEFLSRKRRPTMAQKVKLAKGKEFTFAKSTGAASKYPWDEWFNGDLLLLERSDVDKEGNLTPSGIKRDFEVEVDAMPAKLKTAARRRYKVVQISRRDADGNKLETGIIIKARDMMADEKIAEDVLRAEEKVARKEAKEAGDGADDTNQDDTNAA